MRWRLWHKIIVLILFPVAGVLVVMLRELNNLHIITNKIGIIEAIDDINITFLEVRRYEKNIILFSDEENLLIFNKYFAEFKSRLDTAKQEVLSEINLSNYNHLLQIIESYNSDMEKVIKNIKRKSKLIDEMRPLGRQLISESINKSLVLELRRHEKNYIIYKDNFSIANVHEMSKQVAEGEPRLEYVIRAYMETFKELINTIESESAVLSRLRGYARNIERTIVDVLTKERSDIANLLNRFKMYFLLSIGFLIFIIIVTGYFVAGNIVKTLRKIEMSFKDLSTNDTFSSVAVVDGTYEFYNFIQEYNRAVMKLKAITEESKNKINELEKLNNEILIKQSSLIEMKKDAAIRLLAGEIAHEMNNPLSSVTSLLLVLDEDIPVEDPRKQLIHLMLNDNNRCHNILNNIVDFARKENLKVHKVNIKQLIYETVEIVNRMSGEISLNAGDEKNVDFNIHLNDMPDAVLLDPVLIQQAFVNILTNAYIHSPLLGTVYILGKTHENMIEISVKDEGDGISKEILPHIFEPFFSTRKEEGGHGLGLSITKKIIEKHMGSISVKTGEGHGTTFTVKLPLIVFPSYTC
ncbi:MAG: HAMP domain-containing histidine kinase [Candidatus Magnetoovum sp. WYHC-5]|nr:HAMP domain-containing histidine kinase [Candidatus Magnetoovum sp. WYHC-5]